MKCPNCNETLVMADRQGVEVDYCPKCRGVWLDRGELDKIIERAASFDDGTPDRQDDYKRYPNQQEQQYDRHYKHKKRRGFLGDFFDFD